MTDLNQYEMTKYEECIFYAILAGASIIIAMLFYRNIFFAVVVIPFAPSIKSYVIEEMKQRRRREFMAQFRDELFVLSTAIGAGRSMKDAIGESIPGIMEIHGEGCILGRQLEIIYERLETGGENDVELLNELGVMSGIEDVLDFAAIYAICKKTGASIITAINKAASVIIDKMTIDNEVREIVRRKESEGLLILAMPILIILFLNLFSPDYIDPLYSCFAGRLIMTGVIAGNIGIFGIIQRITQIEI
ncbi:MAG: hypothetical protein PUD55_04110 [Firmicutes bacterium]|nr:hypothetical protein [Bacillota bacterium]